MKASEMKKKNNEEILEGKGKNLSIIRNPLLDRYREKKDVPGLDCPNCGLRNWHVFKIEDHHSLMCEECCHEINLTEEVHKELSEKLSKNTHK